MSSVLTILLVVAYMFKYFNGSRIINFNRKLKICRWDIKHTNENNTDYVLLMFTKIG